MQQPDRIPQHPRGGDRLQADVGPPDLCVGIGQCVPAVFQCGQVADVRGGTGAVDVLAADRAEEAARAALPTGFEGKVLEGGRSPAPLGLFFEGHDEHPGMDSSGNEADPGARGNTPRVPRRVRARTGLPTAASESTSASSGDISPSMMSGALPTTTASISFQPSSASSSARPAASRTRPPSVTSFRTEAWWVWPTPMTAHRVLTVLAPSRTPGCAAGTRRWWRARRRVPARPSRISRAAAPIRMRPVAMIGSAGRAPPEGLTSPTSAPMASSTISS